MAKQPTTIFQRHLVVIFAVLECGMEYMSSQLIDESERVFGSFHGEYLVLKHLKMLTPTDFNGNGVTKCALNDRA